MRDNIQSGDISIFNSDYMVKSPLTNTWMHFTSIDIERRDTIFDYYRDIKYLLQHARDIRPMNHDLSAFCNDEARIFGVKAPRTRTGCEEWTVTS